MSATNETTTVLFDRNGHEIRKGTRVVATPVGFDGTLVVGRVTEIESEYRVSIKNEQTTRTVMRPLSHMLAFRED